jgi:Ohr subfamily peroxiredoxin
MQTVRLPAAPSGSEPIAKEDRVIYTAKVHTEGGREGATSRSPGGGLEVWISLPGRPGSGTNPEQLFAAAWSASFETAIWMAARNMRLKLPANPVIDAEVDLGLTDGFYSVGARLNVKLPGVPDDIAQALLDDANTHCPYSRLLRGQASFRTKLT